MLAQNNLPTTNWIMYNLNFKMHQMFASTVLSLSLSLRYLPFRRWRIFRCRYCSVIVVVVVVVSFHFDRVSFITWKCNAHQSQMGARTGVYVWGRARSSCVNIKTKLQYRNWESIENRWSPRLSNALLICSVSKRAKENELIRIGSKWETQHSRVFASINLANAISLIRFQSARRWWHSRASVCRISTCNSNLWLWNNKAQGTNDDNR